MRKSQFSETLIVEILRDAESGILVADVKRLREFEAETANLKRIYTDLALENAAIKGVLNRKW